MALTDNLVAHWKLDEASGSRADSAGSSALTDNNTVTQTTGKLGNAAVFASANSESLSVADNVALSAGDVALTLACWVYLTTNNAFMGIITKDTGTAYEYDLYFDSVAERFRVYLENGGSSIDVAANTFGAPATATWYFVVARHDPTANTASISVNAGTANSSSYTGGMADTAGSFKLGNDAGFFLNGRLDSVSIWKRALSDAEVTELYNSGNGLEYPFSTGVTGTSALATQVPQVAVSGAQTNSGTSALSATVAAVTSSGAQTNSGTSALSAQVAQVASSGTQTNSGTSVLSAQVAQVASAGISGDTITGTSAISAQVAQAAVTAEETFLITTGTLVLPLATVSADGTAGSEPITGTSAIIAPLADVDAVAEETFLITTGTLVLPLATVSADGAVGSEPVTGTSTLIAALADVDGAAEETFLITTGALVLPLATVASDGTVGAEPVTGTADLIAPLADVDSDGAQTNSGAGDVVAPLATLSSLGVMGDGVLGTSEIGAALAVVGASGTVANLPITGTSALIAPLADEDATGSPIIAGTSALIAPLAVIVSSGGQPTTGAAVIVAPLAQVTSQAELDTPGIGYGTTQPVAGPPYGPLSAVSYASSLQPTTVSGGLVPVSPPSGPLSPQG